MKLISALPFLGSNLLAQDDGAGYTNRHIICLGFLYMVPTPVSARLGPILPSWTIMRLVVRDYRR